MSDPPHVYVFENSSLSPEAFAKMPGADTCAELLNQIEESEPLGWTSQMKSFFSNFLRVLANSEELYHYPSHVCVDKVNGGTSFVWATPTISAQLVVFSSTYMKLIGDGQQETDTLDCDVSTLARNFLNELEKSGHPFDDTPLPPNHIISFDVVNDD